MYGVAGVMALLSSGQVVDKQRERKTTLYLETCVCTVYSVGLFCVFQAVLLKTLKPSLLLHNQCSSLLVRKPAVGMGSTSVWERWTRIPVVGKSGIFQLGTVINHKRWIFAEDVSVPVVMMRAVRKHSL